MTKVFHIRALNSPNGDFREVELDLPATDYVLLDAMEQLRLEDGKRPYLASPGAMRWGRTRRFSSVPAW